MATDKIRYLPKRPSASVAAITLRQPMPWSALWKRNVYTLAYLIHIVTVAASLWLLRRGQFLRSEPQQAYFAAAISLGCFSVGYLIGFPAVSFWDFIECYYPAGQAALTGDLEALRALYVKVVQGFVNIPIVAYLFAPLAWFDKTTAAMLYMLAGVVATLVTWRLLIRLTALDTSASWQMLLLIAANGALINSIKFGNTSHFILLLLVSGLWMLRTEHALIAGILLGLATVMKPALGLFGFFFLLRRDWLGLAGYAVTGITVAITSWLVFGWDLNLFWFNTSILQFGHQWFGTFSVQSVAGFLLRLRAEPTLLTTWQPMTPSAMESLIFRLVVIGAYASALTVCWLSRRRHGQAPDPRHLDAQYLLVICLAIITSPLSWSHYFVWLLLPAAYLLTPQQPLFSQAQIRAAAWLAVLLSTPIIIWPLQFSQPLLAKLYQQLLVSHQLLAAGIWFVVILVSLLRPRHAVITTT